MMSHRVTIALVLGLGMAATAAPAQQVDPAMNMQARETAACGACLGGPAVGLRATPASVLADTGRPKAIEYSDAYAVRLKIHLIGSYLELPLFAAEYFLGQKLLNDTTSFVPGQRSASNSSTRTWHSTVAGGLGVLFTTNTITGIWNLIESRNDPAGGVRKWLHSIAMLLADAGFVMTANAGGDARRTLAGADHHRNLAIGSMSLAAASTIMMWLWKD
jgi:hypothetical protein